MSGERDTQGTLLSETELVDRARVRRLRNAGVTTVEELASKLIYDFDDVVPVLDMTDIEAFKLLDAAVDTLPRRVALGLIGETDDRYVATVWIGVPPQYDAPNLSAKQRAKLAAELGLPVNSLKNLVEDPEPAADVDAGYYFRVKNADEATVERLRESRLVYHMVAVKLPDAAPEKSSLRRVKVEFRVDGWQDPRYWSQNLARSWAERAGLPGKRVWEDLYWAKPLGNSAARSKSRRWSVELKLRDYEIRHLRDNTKLTVVE